MKRLFILLCLLFLLAALAQDTDSSQTTETTQEETTQEEAQEESSPEETAEDPNKRVISIDSSGGTQDGNLRFGPIQYAHPDPEGIEATVSNLTIFAQEAQLRGPEGEEIALTAAKGRRTTTFTNGVRVTRNRLESKGSDLTYTEEDGLGVLVGGVDITVSPKDEEDDLVFIKADSAEFDVDTDVSTSRGNVQLENGNQSAESDELVFEEDRNLGRLTNDTLQVTVRRVDDDGDELVITADVIRVLTDDDKLLATGSVTIVDGSITSKGDIVFFDDTVSRAEIIGVDSLATSVDEEEGFEIAGDRIEQRTDLDTVEIIDDSVPSEFTEDEFQLVSEQG